MANYTATGTAYHGILLAVLGCAIFPIRLFLLRLGWKVLGLLFWMGGVGVLVAGRFILEETPARRLSLIDNSVDYSSTDYAYTHHKHIGWIAFWVAVGVLGCELLLMVVSYAPRMLGGAMLKKLRLPITLLLGLGLMGGMTILPIAVWTAIEWWTSIEILVDTPVIWLIPSFVSVALTFLHIVLCRKRAVKVAIAPTTEATAP